MKLLSIGRTGSGLYLGPVCLLGEPFSTSRAGYLHHYGNYESRVTDQSERERKPYALKYSDINQAINLCITSVESGFDSDTYGG